METMMRTTKGWIALGAVAVLAGGCAVVVLAGHHAIKSPSVMSAARQDGKPRNVVLLVGDGMGTQEITAARYYQGVTGSLNVDRLPFTGFDTTYSLKPGRSAPYRPDFAPDSASTGSMWATGRKSIDGRISQGPSKAADVPGKNYETILEIARAEGKKVGSVTTAEITDATPAVLASHISRRGCQGPSDMAECPEETKAAGGPGSIAEQEVDHTVDVLLGGGRARFTQSIRGGVDAGKTVVESAKGKGYSYVTDAGGLASARKTPLLGLFNKGTMSVEWRGPKASLGKGNDPRPCSEGHRPTKEPSLAAMTSTAISLLQTTTKGFFLQVEGASIDKQDHAANACGQLGETVAFDKAVGVALDFQEKHPDTLVVVTADHAQASQIIADDASGSSLPTGYSTNLKTKDGAVLTLTYGTAGYGGTDDAPESKPSHQQHTGAVVPVWGIGPRADRVLGTNDHTDLFALLK
jgi:alkaline phosphatase/streptomycin-6-phosphatase